MIVRHRLAAAAVAVIVVTGATAAAQEDANRAQARALYEHGQQALRARDYVTAADLLGRADALYHAPTVALGFARAQVGLGKLVAAHETYTRIVRQGTLPNAAAAFVRAVEDARRERDELAVRLPTVVLSVPGVTNATVTLDGAPVPAAALGVKRFVDPGTHRVRASAVGFLVREATFAVSEGGAAAVELALARDPSHPTIGGGEDPDAPSPVDPKRRSSVSDARPERTTSLAAIGSGALGFGLAAAGFGVSGAVAAAGLRADLVDRCPSAVCAKDDGAGAAAYDRARLFGAGGLVGGGVGFGAGALLLALSDEGARALAPPTRTSVGAALIGLGAGGVASGGASTIMALAVRSELRAACPSGACPASEEARVAELGRLTAMSIVGYAVGVAGLGTGAVLLVAAPEPDSGVGRLDATAWISPTSVGTTWRF